MSFASEVKREIIELDIDEKYLRILFLAIYNNSKNKKIIDSTNVSLLEFIRDLVKKIYHQESLISSKNQRLYQLEFNDNLEINEAYNEKNNREISYYLAGIFLLNGSLNSPISPQYHLEVNPLNIDETNKIMKMIKKFRLNPKVIERRGKMIIYLKKSDQIADFLSIIHAESKMLEFENIRIERDFFNSTTRVNNCEIANGIKTMETAKKQIDFINKVGLKNLKDNLYIIAKLRLTFIDLSLKDLADLFNQETGKRINKSTVSYFFKQIELLAEGGYEKRH